MATVVYRSFVPRPRPVLQGTESWAGPGYETKSIELDLELDHFSRSPEVGGGATGTIVVAVH